MHPSPTDGTELSRLLAASADGDHSAFARLYDLTNARVYGLALRVLNDRSHAEEVVQESYLHFWQQAHRYSSARGSVVNWMLTIAHRRSVDRIRSEELYRRRGSEYTSANTAVPSTPLVEVVEQHEETLTLRRCLGRLTNLQRDSIELSYFDGMTYPEVAAYTATPLPTIKSRIRDGLRSLRHCVKTEEV
ncbi:sigma-70 family RNA polymerase sigma factor [Gordonia sp. HY285]|uniref:sigma-70 family RNA polymerase sigma factor n=1 Tax=Gordonia liuliyuniae TaxID=2911517 RepID=UPI001F01D8D0|nr:sigma-70 family RNA polymerase sigma factor [Gordonia liuliyuniae]MCF8609617.1 sigma-70 family RNA polymerase sigma factor [Gordonia liuliyuniae]